jgi:mono/diheme cytochrome c family protein
MNRRATFSAKSLGMVLIAAVLAGCPADEPAPPPPPPAEPAAPPAAPATPAAPDVDAATLPAGVTPEMVQMGQQVYAGAGICFTCHGQSAEGTPLGPNLRDDNWLWVDSASPDFFAEMVAIIRTGVTQPREYPAPMPPMGGANLTDEQLQAVAAYVVALN